MDEQARGALENFLLRATGAAAVRMLDVRLLSGGAIQENWLIELEIEGGRHAGRGKYVLRTDSPNAGVATSHGRREEFRLLKRVFEAGVKVPEPLWLCEDRSVLGRPFFIMRHAGGKSAGHLLVKEWAQAPEPGRLAAQLGRELARIHSVRPPDPALAFLPDESAGGAAPALRRIEEFRQFLDGYRRAHPALEWGLQWLARHAPPRGRVTLCHGDFRTGNYLADASGVTAILDWEFAGWGDPLEDIGWFCAKCWRFRNVNAEAGGIGPREDFYRAYEHESGRQIDRAQVKYWEVMAHARWAVIALQQAERQMSGGENSLLLALTGHVVPELEWEILQSTGDD